MAAKVDIRVEKTFRHPRDRVFDAFVDPTRVGDWLFHTPEGVMERVDYDPAPGGGFAIVERRGDQLARHFGKFVQVDRPERIVFDFRTDEDGEWTRVTVIFEVEGEGCRVVLTHDLAAEWAAYQARTVQGWTTILDGLEVAVEAGAGETFLDRLIGEWTFESGAFPDEPQWRQSGEETVTRQGVWTVVEPSDKARFQLTLNPATGRVTGDFIAWQDPTLWTYDGTIEGDRMVLASRGPSFDVEGAVVDYQDVWEIQSPHTRTLTGRLKGEDGTWRDFLWTRYRRKGSTE